VCYFKGIGSDCCAGPHVSNVDRVPSGCWSGYVSFVLAKSREDLFEVDWEFLWWGREAWRHFSLLQHEYTQKQTASLISLTVIIGLSVFIHVRHAEPLVAFMHYGPEKTESSPHCGGVCKVLFSSLWSGRAEPRPSVDRGRLPLWNPFWSLSVFKDKQKRTQIVSHIAFTSIVSVHRRPPKFLHSEQRQGAAHKYNNLKYE